MAEHCANRRVSEVVGTHAGDHAIESGQQSDLEGSPGSLSHGLGAEPSRSTDRETRRLTRDVMPLLYSVVKSLSI